MSLTDDPGSTDEHDGIPSNMIRLPERPLPHRWTCPFCGQSRVTIADSDAVDRDEVAARARSALRSHILATVGDGHGPRSGYPRDFDHGSIEDHVEFLGR